MCTQHLLTHRRRARRRRRRAAHKDAGWQNEPPPTGSCDMWIARADASAWTCTNAVMHKLQQAAAPTFSAATTPRCQSWQQKQPMLERLACHVPGHAPCYTALRRRPATLPYAHHWRVCTWMARLQLRAAAPPHPPPPAPPQSSAPPGQLPAAAASTAAAPQPHPEAGQPG